MADRLRLFIAIEVPPPVLSALAMLIEGLRRTDAGGLRPVRPEGIHLTLRFLGSVDRQRVQDIMDAVAAAAGAISPLAVQLGRPGVFPRRGPPRVLWVGLDGQVEALTELQATVEKSLSSIGFPEGRQPFHPHLTVARLRDGTPAADRQAAAEAFLEYDVPPDLRVHVQHLSLIQSALRPGGAIYSRLAHMPLRSPPAERTRGSASIAPASGPEI